MGFIPKFIYFDLDDTLLDHKQAERSALQDIHRHFDLFSDTNSDDLIDVYHAVNSKQWELYGQGKVNREQLQRNRFELTLRDLGLDDCRFRAIGLQYMQYYKNYWQWIDGAEGVFQMIKNDFPIGVLTNGFAETQKKKFKQFNLYDQVNHLVISEEVGAMKPHPDVFKYATDLTGYQPEEILYIGDSYSSDIIGGANFGWNVAWFTQNGEAEKHQKADFVFNDFRKLADWLEV